MVRGCRKQLEVGETWYFYFSDSKPEDGWYVTCTDLVCCGQVSGRHNGSTYGIRLCVSCMKKAGLLW